MEADDMHDPSRRMFLTRLGQGALMAAAGNVGAAELAAAVAGADTVCDPEIERLVGWMQEKPPDALMVELVRELRAGTRLETLLGAGAIANARAFAGEDYEGYHALMALLPAHHMAARMPEKLRALPVLKVLHRNSARIQATGGARDRLRPVAAAESAADAVATLRRFERGGDMQAAERLFRAICDDGNEAAFRAMRPLVRDDINVHRTVLAWRSFDLLPVVGQDHAHTVLRQFVRFCIDQEQDRIRKARPVPAIRDVVPAALDRHRLLGRELGRRQPDDGVVAELRDAVFAADRARAADRIAAALAEGFDPEPIGEAISLAANKLLRHDSGKARVHGASVGVHASDAANAWRHLARLGAPTDRAADLVAAAFHTGGQSEHVAPEPYGFDEQLAALQSRRDGAEVEAALVEGIERNDQRAACAAAARWGELGLGERPILDCLLRYAVSEDGALHAEKYFHTVCDEFASTRPALRWQHVVALARVTASEYGERAPGHDLTRRLLQD